MRVFVSYRRDDTHWVARLLHDRLGTAFGEDNIFLDVDAMPLGVDYRDVISSSLRDVDVVLALIGPDWNPGRLSAATDPVRAELYEALQQNKLLIPVLIGDTPMPQPEVLPTELEPFAYRNASRVRPDPDFAADADRLIAAIRPSGDPGSIPPGRGETLAGTATVSLVRLKQAYVGRALAIYLEVDGKQVGSVKNGRTVKFQVPPGPHTVRATANSFPKKSYSPELPVDLKPGTNTTLRVRFPATAVKSLIELLQDPQ